MALIHPKRNMNELCKDLILSIWREDDPDPKEKNKERIRVKLVSELDMTEIEVTQQISVTTHQSRRYHVIEAVVIVLRKAVSEAFREGMISDSVGEWKITKPKGSDQGFDVELNDALL